MIIKDIDEFKTKLYDERDSKVTSPSLLNPDAVYDIVLRSVKLLKGVKLPTLKERLIKKDNTAYLVKLRDPKELSSKLEPNTISHLFSIDIKSTCVDYIDSIIGSLESISESIIKHGYVLCIFEDMTGKNTRLCMYLSRYSYSKGE